MSIKETKDGVILTVYVKPNSPKFQIELDGCEIVVHATEEPERGKVNKEIVKEFIKFFGTKVEIICGATSKQKKLLIKERGKKEIEDILDMRAFFYEVDKNKRKKVSEATILKEIQSYRMEKRSKKTA
jgi:uncharacterized protein